MAIKILHDYEKGTSLQYINNKMEVRPDNSGNVQLSVTENGLRGDVVLPAPFDPAALQQEIDTLKQKAQTLEQELAAEKAKVEALESREDIHVTNAEIVNDTELKITISGAQPITVNLAKFLNVVPTPSQVYAEIKAEILRDVKDEIKGEVMQDFAGNTSGYLIKV